MYNYVNDNDYGDDDYGDKDDDYGDNNNHYGDDEDDDIIRGNEDDDYFLQAYLPTSLRFFPLFPCCTLSVSSSSISLPGGGKGSLYFGGWGGARLFKQYKTWSCELCLKL